MSHTTDILIVMGTHYDLFRELAKMGTFQPSSSNKGIMVVYRIYINNSDRLYRCTNEIIFLQI